MNQKRSESFIKKVDTNTELLISRFTNIIALSASTSSQEVQASEMLQIELNAQTMVRLVEELLSVSRTLKESWILGQLPESKEVNDPTIGVTEKINAVLEKVLNSSKYEEEVEIEQEEELVESNDNNDGENDKDIKEEDVNKEDIEGEVAKQEADEEGNEGGINKDMKKEEENKEENKEDNKEDKDMNMSFDSEGSKIIKPEVKTGENDKNQDNQDPTQTDSQQNDNIEQPIEDILDISDNPNFDELDFESFGNMGQNDDNNNDIIMLD